MKAGKNVVHYTLLSCLRVAVGRFDTILTSVVLPSNDVIDSKDRGAF